MLNKLFYLFQLLTIHTLFHACTLNERIDLCYPINTPNDNATLLPIAKDKSRKKEIPNRYEQIRKLEKNRSKVVSYSAKKILKGNDYTKILLAQIRYTGTEWVFHACHNKDSLRHEILKNELIDNRIMYHEKLTNKEKKFCQFQSDTDSTFQSSKIKDIYSVAGNHKIEDRKNISPLSKNDLGLEADFVNIPFLFWCLGERNGAYIKAKFGNLDKADYRIEKLFIEKENNTRYLKLTENKNKDIIYLKSVENQDRKIQVPEKVIKRIYKYHPKIKDIKGDHRTKKALVYGISALHCIVLIPLQVGGFTGIFGAYGLGAKIMTMIK